MEILHLKRRKQAF
jgi:hypothetical protein